MADSSCQQSDHFHLFLHDASPKRQNSDSKLVPDLLILEVLIESGSEFDY